MVKLDSDKMSTLYLGTAHDTAGYLLYFDIKLVIVVSFEVNLGRA